MNISPVNSTNSTQKGKKIGTAAGFGVGSAFVIKNAKDTFVKATAAAAEKVGGKALGYAIAGGVSALAIGATTLAGRTIGTLVDKVTQKASEKAAKAALAKSISENIAKSDMNVVKLDTLESMINEDLKGMSTQEVQAIMQEQQN